MNSDLEDINKKYYKFKQEWHKGRGREFGENKEKYYLTLTPNEEGEGIEISKPIPEPVIID
jgi:hypothetical protein